jgi:hypothetical protein
MSYFNPGGYGGGGGGGRGGNPLAKPCPWWSNYDCPRGKDCGYSHEGPGCARGEAAGGGGGGWHGGGGAGGGAAGGGGGWHGGGAGGGAAGGGGGWHGAAVASRRREVNETVVNYLQQLTVNGKKLPKVRVRQIIRQQLDENPDLGQDEEEFQELVTSIMEDELGGSGGGGGGWHGGAVAVAPVAPVAAAVRDVPITYIISSHGGTSTHSDYNPPRGCQLIFYQPHLDSLVAPNAVQSQIGYSGLASHVNDIYCLIESAPGSRLGNNLGVEYARSTWDYTLSPDEDGQWRSGVICYDTTCETCYAGLTKFEFQRRGYSEGYCNRCFQDRRGSSQTEAFYRCERHDFDLCQSCYGPRPVFNIDTLGRNGSITLSQLVRMIMSYNNTHFQKHGVRFIPQIHVLICRIDLEQRPRYCVTALRHSGPKTRYQDDGSTRPCPNPKTGHSGNKKGTKSKRMRSKKNTRKTQHRKHREL